MKGGSADELMSPVYALMRCVDNTLIGQRQGSDGWRRRPTIDDILFDQILPDKEGADLGI